MNERFLRMAQGTSEWFEIRRGKLTASRMASVMRTRKDGKRSETRYKLMLEIAAEIMTESVSTKYVSAPMQWGNEQEPIARTEYEIRTGEDVRLIGFIQHPKIPLAGCSPDGILHGKRKGVEFKCPETTTHIDYLIAKRLPPDYEPQVMWNLACSEYDAWDFVSFDPRMPKKHQMLIVEVPRNEDRIKDMNDAANVFIAEVQDLIHKLESGENYLVEQLQASIHQVGRGAQQV
jgi:putative phage-type endonuclease